MSEHREKKLAANAQASERLMRRLFRTANALQKLAEQRKRLLKAPIPKPKTAVEAAISQARAAHSRARKGV